MPGGVFFISMRFCFPLVRVVPFRFALRSFDTGNGAGLICLPSSRCFR